MDYKTNNRLFSKRNKKQTSVTLMNFAALKSCMYAAEGNPLICLLQTGPLPYFNLLHFWWSNCSIEFCKCCTFFSNGDMPMLDAMLLIWSSGRHYNHSVTHRLCRRVHILSQIHLTVCIGLHFITNDECFLKWHRHHKTDYL